MASAGEVAMGGESSSTVFSSDEEDQNSKLDEDEGGPDRDSSSISSEDSFESDFESESFTDVTPLHSISNSPLPNQVRMFFEFIWQFITISHNRY